MRESRESGGDERTQGQDVLLLLEGLQSEIGRRSITVRQVKGLGRSRGVLPPRRPRGPVRCTRKSSAKSSAAARYAAEANQIAVYFEAAAVIVTLVLLGQVLGLRARSQTGAAIRALLGLAPKVARRVSDDGREEDVPLDQVQPGDCLRIGPGEKVPVDGMVLEGGSAVDESNGHRRADAGPEAGGGSRDRRHRQ